MNIETYIDLQQLLEHNKTTHEQNRTLGLVHESDNDMQKLNAYRDKHLDALHAPRLSQEISKYLYSVTLILGILSLIIGVFSGVGLLNYGGKEPVNVVYFIVMVALVPLVTMSMAIWSMFKASKQQSVLVHISPAYWMEKIIHFLPNTSQNLLKNIRISPLLLNFLIIKRSQLLALLFSIGLFIALIWKVSTQDLAFVWSTTLQVSPSDFHSFLKGVAFAWRDLVPSALPSLELVEQSQYLRLGGKINDQMVHNAVLLGQWWKFLAIATLFYAIFLRILIWLLASFGLRQAIDKSINNLSGASRVLYEMSTPLVSSQSAQIEKSFTRSDVSYSRITTSMDGSYDSVLGWAMSDDEIIITNDALGILSQNIADVGGTNKLAQDRAIIERQSGNILLLVKAWEPPTMDIVDFIYDLSNKVTKITLLPIGTSDLGYECDSREFDVWARKMQSIDNKKVWLCQRC